MVTAPFALALALAAAGPTEEAHGLDLALRLDTASPTALGTGLLLGPGAAADLRLDTWRLGARLTLGMGAENDLTWHVAHTELRLLVRAGWALTLGRGELGAGAGVGTLVLHEARARHQADRLGEAGIDAERSAWTAGPHAALDASVRLVVLDPWAVTLSGGPTLTWLTFDGSGAWVAGWSAAIAVAFATEP